MTRSKRRKSISGITTAESDKEAKKKANRQARRAVKMTDLEQEDPPHEKEFGNPWLAPKDGKFFFDPQKYPELMRK